MQILLRLQKQPCPGNPIQLRTQTLNDLRCRNASLREGLEFDVDISGIAGAAGGTGASEAKDRGNRRIFLYDPLQLGELFGHRWKGDGLIGDDLSKHDAGILFREERRRQQLEQIDVPYDQADQHEPNQQCVVKYDMQPAPIGVLESLELALHPDDPARPGMQVSALLEDVGAHAGRNGKRDHHRDQDGD